MPPTHDGTLSAPDQHRIIITTRFDVFLEEGDPCDMWEYLTSRHHRQRLVVLCVIATRLSRTLPRTHVLNALTSLTPIMHNCKPFGHCYSDLSPYALLSRAGTVMLHVLTQGSQLFPARTLQFALYKYNGRSSILSPRLLLAGSAWVH